MKAAVSRASLRAFPYAAARRRCRALSLVEVTLALAITAFVLLVLLAMFPVGLKSNQVSVRESVAVNLLTAVVSDLQVSATNALSAPATNASPLFAISPLPFAATNGQTAGVYYLSDQGAATNSTSAAYRLEVSYVPAAATASTAGVNLRISWPAQATTVNAQGRVETYYTFVRP